MKSYSEWLPEARVAISGADDALLNQQIAATIREFFTRTVWVETLFPITLVEDRDRYSFGSLSSYYALYLMSAKIDDVPIVIYPQEPLTHSNRSGVWVDGANEQVVVTPIPGESMAGSLLRLKSTLKPLEICDQVPSRVFEMYFDEILDGIKGRMYSMPSKPWTDRQLGVLHTRKFRAGIARARTAMRTGYSSAEPIMRFPSWA